MNNRLQSTGLAALSFSVSAGILALALTPGMASAAPVIETEEYTVTGERLARVKRVATADLDLTSASDLKRLDARIRGAIGDVCFEDVGRWPTLSEQQCRSDARQSADQQVAALRQVATAMASRGEAFKTSAIAIVAAR